MVLLDRVRAGRGASYLLVTLPLLPADAAAADAGRHRELCNQNRPSIGVLVLYRRFSPVPGDGFRARERPGEPALLICNSTLTAAVEHTIRGTVES